MEDTGKIKQTLTITIVDEMVQSKFTMAKVMQKYRHVYPVALYCA